MAFIRNDGGPRLSMSIMITGSLANIVLDYTFMYPLNMGIFERHWLPDCPLSSDWGQPLCTCLPEETAFISAG